VTVEITGLCQDHSFETAEDVCRRCGLEFCELCMVYPFGARRPFCKECAMVVGGVRSHASRPEMPKRELKRRLKAWHARAAAANRPRQDGSDRPDPILTDPLAPTQEDLERVPVSVPDDGAEVAAALAESFNEPTPAPAPATRAPADDPADGVAPPIDWSQPFG
jgi:hypothetical protein